LAHEIGTFCSLDWIEVVLFLCDCRDRDGELTIQFTIPAESRTGPWNFR
jgi:hypothetical protein